MAKKTVKKTKTYQDHCGAFYEILFEDGAATFATCIYSPTGTKKTNERFGFDDNQLKHLLGFGLWVEKRFEKQVDLFG